MGVSVTISSNIWLWHNFCWNLLMKTSNASWKFRKLPVILKIIRSIWAILLSNDINRIPVLMHKDQEDNIVQMSYLNNLNSLDLEFKVAAKKLWVAPNKTVIWHVRQGKLGSFWTLFKTRASLTCEGG